MIRKLLGMNKPDYLTSNLILLSAVIWGIYATFVLSAAGFLAAPGLIGFLYTRAVLGAVVLVPGSIVHFIFLGWDRTFGTLPNAAPWVAKINSYWFIIWPISFLLIGEMMVLCMVQFIALNAAFQNLIVLLH